MRLGVLILAIGGTLDVVYHAAPPVWAVQLDVVVGSDGVVAHLLTLFGMVVTLVGLEYPLGRVAWRQGHGPLAHPAIAVPEIGAHGRATTRAGAPLVR